MLTRLSGRGRWLPPPPRPRPRPPLEMLLARFKSSISHGDTYSFTTAFAHVCAATRYVCSDRLQVTVGGSLETSLQGVGKFLENRLYNLVQKPTVLSAKECGDQASWRCSNPPCPSQYENRKRVQQAGIRSPPELFIFQCPSNKQPAYGPGNQNFEARCPPNKAHAPDT